jgi:hypothetical protein
MSKPASPSRAPTSAARPPRSGAGAYFQVLRRRIAAFLALLRGGVRIGRRVDRDDHKVAQARRRRGPKLATTVSADEAERKSCIHRRRLRRPSAGLIVVLPKQPAVKDLLVTPARFSHVPLVVAAIGRNAVSQIVIYLLGIRIIDPVLRVEPRDRRGRYLAVIATRTPTRLGKLRCWYIYPRQRTYRGG